jgi:hypothetical protein
MGTHVNQNLLDVMPLAKMLGPDDVEALAKDFPDFPVDQLLDEASQMGGPPASAPPAESASEGDEKRLRALRFQVQLARRAINRVLPQCETTWRAIGGRLRSAARMEFYAGILTLLGGGGAAGSAALSQMSAAAAGGLVAFAASAISLYSQSQRRSLRDDVNLATIYATLAESLGTLHMLKDAIDLWATGAPALLLDDEERVSDTAKRTLESCSKVDSAIASVGPLLSP